MIKKPYYILFNIVMIVLSVIILMFNGSILRVFLSQTHNLVFIGGIVLTIVCVHFFKALRYYLVLLEHNMRLSSFLCSYFKVDFVNVMLPFKVGEVLRVVTFSEKIGSYRHGITSVLVDRFFDTLVLFMVLVFNEYYSFHQISITSYIFLIVLLVFLASYFLIRNSYKYLNNFIIINYKGKKAIILLKCLENLKSGVDIVHDLVKSRVALIMGLSLVCWVLECAIIVTLSRVIEGVFLKGRFSYFINSSFWGQGNEFTLLYLSLTASVLLGMMLMAYASVRIKDGNYEKSNHNIR